MAFTFYDASVHQASSALKSLRHILEQGQKQDPDGKFLQARIHPDMRDLAFQVTVATMFAEKMLARALGVEEEPPARNFPSYAAMYDHIDHVVQRLAQADKATVNQRENETVSLVPPSGTEYRVPALAYANGFALPHIFFHVTTAYDILRKEGVPLEKRDYIQAFLQPYMPSS